MQLNDPRRELAEHGCQLELLQRRPCMEHPKIKQLKKIAFATPNRSQNLPFVLCDQFGCGGRCRSTQIGDKVRDRKIDLVSDGRDDRYL